MGERLVRVFTHPACPGCPAAVRAVWEACAARPGVALRAVSLDVEQGLAEAHAAGVRTIPTVIVSDGGVEIARWIGAPERARMEEALR